MDNPEIWQNTLSDVFSIPEFLNKPFFFCSHPKLGGSMPTFT